MEPTRDKRILYGRRRGKPLRKGQQALVEHDLPGITVPMQSDRLDLPVLFGSEFDKFWLEIGFGSGEHLA